MATTIRRFSSSAMARCERLFEPSTFCRAMSSSSASSSSAFSTRPPLPSSSPPIVMMNRTKDRGETPFPGANIRDGRMKLCLLIDADRFSVEEYHNTILPALLNPVAAAEGPLLVREETASSLSAKERSEDEKEQATQAADHDHPSLKPPPTICLQRYFSRLMSNAQLAQTWANTKYRQQQQSQRTVMSSSSSASSPSSTGRMPKFGSPEWKQMSQRQKLPPLEHFRVDGFVPTSMQMLIDAKHILQHKEENGCTDVCFVTGICDDSVPVGSRSITAKNTGARQHQPPTDDGVSEDDAPSFSTRDLEEHQEFCALAREVVLGSPPSQASPSPSSSSVMLDTNEKTTAKEGTTADSNTTNNNKSTTTTIGRGGNIWVMSSVNLVTCVLK